MDHDQPGAPDLGGPEQDAVRRLLADARHTEPVPPSVAARLDAVLADLDAGRTPSGSAPVARLDRHRRLGARRLLIAAAAVIAVGSGAAQVLHLDSAGTSGDTAGSSEAAAGSAALPDPATDAPRSAFPAAGSASSTAEPGAETTDGSVAADSSTLAEATQGRLRSPRVVQGLVRVSDADFSRDARRIQRLSAPLVAKAATSDDAAACAPAPYGPGRLVLVRFRGDPAVLALRPRDGGSAQVADLLRCGTAEVLRSTTLR